jgi:PAS domain S-box-containing protein
LVQLHWYADVAIWGAYLAIPCVLIWFIRRKKGVPFPAVFWLFGAFILSCGTTHLVDAFAIDTPFYRFLGLCKVVTATVSWVTVLALIPIAPRALAMRTPEEMEREIRQRIEAERALQLSYDEMEERVRQRTWELAEANEQLQAEIHERLRAEAEVRAQREWFRVVLTSIGDGVIVTDTAERINFVNGTAEQLLGATEAGIRGRPLHEVFTLCEETTRQAIENPIRCALVQERVVGLSNHTLLVTPDGRERLIDDSAAPVRGEDGQIAGAVLVFRDVTERHQLEESVRQSQKLAAIGQLAGGIAHNFNNLMAIVVGYADLLRTTLPPDSPVYEQLGIILDAGMRATTLTRQLQAFSRKRPVAPRLTSPSELLDELLRLLRNVIPSSITLHLTAPADLPRVRIDPGQIQQALMNLAINARDAMPRGGHLWFEADSCVLDADLRLRHPHLEPGPGVRIRIRDTGCGMDGTTLSHLFEPFFTTKPVGQGTGLGLASAHGVILASRGAIEVVSQVGHGTTVSIYLPAFGESAVAVSVPPPTPISARCLRILLVEDETSVRGLAEAVLRGQGHEVHSAPDGLAALELVRDHLTPIELLLTDVLMPGLSGPDLYDRLRERFPGLAVLFMSGYPTALREDGGNRIPPGAPLLEKPFRQADLLAALAPFTGEVAP